MITKLTELKVWKVWEILDGTTENKIVFFQVYFSLIPINVAGPSLQTDSDERGNLNYLVYIRGYFKRF